jgi:hypothetical protein
MQSHTLAQGAVIAPVDWLKHRSGAGCGGVLARDGRADRSKTQKVKFAKIEISKLRKSQNLKAFITIVSTRSIAKLLSARS